MKRSVQAEGIMNAALEKPLLGVHAAMDLEGFWQAAQRLIQAAVPAGLLGLAFPSDGFWGESWGESWGEFWGEFWGSRPVTTERFAAELLQSYLAAHPRSRFVHVDDLYPDPRAWRKSAFYRQNLAPQNCRFALGLCFWRAQRLLGGIAIFRTAGEGDFAPAEMKLLAQLYPHLQLALRRVANFESEHAVRLALEDFLRPLPLPTLFLRWGLTPFYRNRAAAESCALWEVGPARTRMKTGTPIPPQVLERCQEMKQEWERQGAPPAEALVHHPRWSYLRAVIRLNMPPAGAGRPHFVIAFEDQRSAPPGGVALSHWSRLTVREQQLARLVCDGRSNQEIADEGGLSLETVKKHLHTIFRKLEVTSRSRLMTLLVLGGSGGKRVLGGVGDSILIRGPDTRGE